MSEEIAGFESFSPLARQAVNHARMEAKKFKHESTGSIHLLLGLMGVGTGVARRILCDAGISKDQLRKKIIQEFPPETDSDSTTPPSCVKELQDIFAKAVKESETLGHDKIDTGHLLLGILPQQEELTLLQVDGLVQNLMGARAAAHVHQLHKIPGMGRDMESGAIGTQVNEPRGLLEGFPGQGPSLSQPVNQFRFRHGLTLRPELLIQLSQPGDNSLVHGLLAGNADVREEHFRCAEVGSGAEFHGVGDGIHLLQNLEEIIGDGDVLHRADLPAALHQEALGLQ